MGTKAEKQAREKNWVLPGTKLTHKEFIEGIRKAEEGPFYTLKEIQEMRRQWRNSRKSS